MAFERDVPVRKRMRRREVRGAVRFITFSNYHHLPLLGRDSQRDMVKARIINATRTHAIEVIAWVIMPEHLHLMLRPMTDAPLWKALESLKKSVSYSLIDDLTERDDRLLAQTLLPDGRHRVWQKGGGFDRNVRNDGEIQREIAYIHSNPVKRGLVKHPCDWEWSSARWWIARCKGAEHDPADVPCVWPPGDPRAWAMWRGFLKRPPDCEKEA